MPRFWEQQLSMGLQSLCLCQIIYRSRDRAAASLQMHFDNDNKNSLLIR